MTGNASPETASSDAGPHGPSIAIVGSGPSGLYAADALHRKRPDARIDIIDRLPTPFGLVRAGVAPDHQGTKNIVRQFERTLTKPGVRYLGNVTLGRDIGLEALRAAYDAVILAVGAPRDRALGIDGDDLGGVYGSAAFVGWYNGHPDFADLAPRLPDGSGPDAVAIVGNGNVALDIARLLAKSEAELTGSDICRHAQDAIAGARIRDIYLIGRRGPVEASFTSAELGELGHLERARPVIEAASLEAADLSAVEDPKTLKVKEKNLEILRNFASRTESDAPIRIHLLFHAAPRGIGGTNGRVDRLTVERTRVENGRAVGTGETLDLAVSTVITAIGYRCAEDAGLPVDNRRGVVRNNDGVVDDGLYVVGWAKRGPSGVIPTNRADSLEVAKRVLDDLEGIGETAGKPGPATLDAHLAAAGVRVTDFEDWRKIDAAETARAAEGRPREKLTSVEAMLAVLG